MPYSGFNFLNQHDANLFKNASGTSPYDVDPSKAAPDPPAGKYPTGVGRGYRGEFPGFIYDPFSDTYYPDPKVANDYRYSTGLAKKPPSTWDQMKPQVAMLAGMKGISDPKGLFSLFSPDPSNQKGILGAGVGATKDAANYVSKALGYDPLFGADGAGAGLLADGLNQGLGYAAQVAPEMTQGLADVAQWAPTAMETLPQFFFMGK